MPDLLPESPKHSKTPPSPWKDFLRPSRGQLVVGVALMLTALLVTWTLRSAAQQPEFANARQADLVQLLDTVTGQSRRLEAELRELESTRNRLLSGADQADAANAEAERRLMELQILAGTVKAEGPGVRITIKDPDAKVTPALMLNAIEELRDAGAEVIELNDQVRLVMRSSITTNSAGQIVVDEVALKTPYIIDAIGDPQTLEAGARFRGGLVSEVESARIGGSVIIFQSDQIEIDSVVVATPNEFAKPR